MPAQIDAAAFPHLLDAILAHAPPAALEALRATSHAFRDRVDALLARRLSDAVLSPCEGKGVIVTARAGGYAGLRTPPTRVMRARCALVRVLEIGTARPAAAALTRHMRPDAVCIGPADGAGLPAATTPVTADAVTIRYTPGTSPFAITAHAVTVAYAPLPASLPSLPAIMPATMSATLPPCRASPCAPLLEWLPRAKTHALTLDFGALSLLPETHAAQLLHALAGPMVAGARVTLVAPERVFGVSEPAAGQAGQAGQAGRAEAAEPSLPGHVMYALVGHLFAEAHGRVRVPMGPRVAAMVNVQVAKALGRLRVVPGEGEWSAEE